MATDLDDVGLPSPRRAHDVPASRRRRHAVLLWGSILLACAISSPLHAPLNNPNEGVRVFTVKALVEQHSFVINDIVKAWGFIDDKSVVDGRLYQSKAPLVTLLAAAGYAAVHPFTGDLERSALTRLCRVVGGFLPALLVAALMWRTLNRSRSEDDPEGNGLAPEKSQRQHAVVLVGILLGSGVVASLHVFSGHALAALCPAVVVALWRHRGGDAHRQTLIATALLVLAASAEYPAALCLPLVLPLWWRSPRRGRTALTALMVAIVAAAPAMVAHTAMFGSPFTTGYSHLESAAYRPLVAGTTFGIGLPDPSVWWTVLCSVELGLFVYAPITILGVVGLGRRLLRLFTHRKHFKHFKHDPTDEFLQVLSAVVVVVAMLLFIAGFRGWRGGWSVGPRYILELVGVLGVLALDGVDAQRLSRRHLGTVFLVLSVWLGVLHSGLAGAFFPHLPDVLPAPIGQFVLPMIARGLCPDSPVLWLTHALGAGPGIAAFVVAVVVFIPVAMLTWWTSKRIFVGVVGVTVLVASTHIVTAPQTASAGLEVRRLYDNWRPEIGNPWLMDVAAVDDDTWQTTPVEGGRPASDAVAFAIDRARTVRGDIRCAEAPRPRHHDVGAGATLLRGILDGDGDAGTPEKGEGSGRLIVVDDALAAHIAPLGGGHLVVAAHDLARWRRPLPCFGDVEVVISGPLPAALEHLTVRQETPLPPRPPLPLGLRHLVLGRL